MASNVGAMELESGTPIDAGLENDGAPGIGLEDEGLVQKVGGGGGAGATFWHGGSVYDARLNAVFAQVFCGEWKVLLAARKFRRATSTHYIISMNSKDMSRGSTTFIGKLRSNFLGTEFTIYDSQPPHSGVLSSNRGTRCIGSKQLSSHVHSGSYNVAHIAYELNVMGMRGPRRMQCTLHIIPASAMELEGNAPTPTEFTASTLVSGLLSKDKLLVLKNKAPRWHEQLRRWYLDFRGRVTVRSVQNFQLVVASSTEAPATTTQSNHNKVLLQFGKIGNDMFTMDSRYPLNAFQAFAICLSSFGTKWLCG